MMGAGYLVVGALCYAAFFVSFVYFIGFIAGFSLLPTHVDKGLFDHGPDASVGWAVLIDLLLIAVFGLQHSVMARKGFKAWWTAIVPEGAERSVYCLGSALALGAMFLFWHPIDAVVWNVTSPLGRGILWAIFLLGVGVVFISTWLINHFELFGLAQSWRAMCGSQPTEVPFRTPLFYRLVRHPIYTGFTIALWAVPYMTFGHLLLSGALTVYILIGISYEERDLVDRFGAKYEEYRSKVSMLLPLPRGK